MKPPILTTLLLIASTLLMPASGADASRNSVPDFVPEKFMPGGTAEDLQPQQVRLMQEAFDSTPHNRQMQNAVTVTPVDNLALNRVAVTSLENTFSCKLLFQQ